MKRVTSSTKIRNKQEFPHIHVFFFLPQGSRFELDTVLVGKVSRKQELRTVSYDCQPRLLLYVMGWNRNKTSISTEPHDLPRGCRMHTPA